MLTTTLVVATLLQVEAQVQGWRFPLQRGHSALSTRACTMNGSFCYDVRCPGFVRKAPGETPLGHTLHTLPPRWLLQICEQCSLVSCGILCNNMSVV